MDALLDTFRSSCLWTMKMKTKQPPCQSLRLTSTKSVFLQLCIAIGTLIGIKNTPYYGYVQAFDEILSQKEHAKEKHDESLVPTSSTLPLRTHSSDSHDATSSSSFPSEEEENKFDQLLHQFQSSWKIPSIQNTEQSVAIASSYLIDSSIQPRLNKIFKNNKVKTPQCAAKIIYHFNKYISALANEDPLPFSQTMFTNECEEDIIKDYDNLPYGISLMSLMEKTYQPLRNESLYIDKDDDLILLYGILTHGSSGAISTIRLIEALSSSSNYYYNGNLHDTNDQRTLFVVHVDGKEESDEAYHNLIQYALDKDYVHILPNEFRIRVNWGGFTMVKAT